MAGSERAGVLAARANLFHGRTWLLAPGEASAEALLLSVRQAVALYRQREPWRRLIENAMACDFSWSRSAKEYESLYREIASLYGAKGV